MHEVPPSPSLGMTAADKAGGILHGRQQLRRVIYRGTRGRSCLVAGALSRPSVQATTEHKNTRNPAAARPPLTSQFVNPAADVAASVRRGCPVAGSWTAGHLLTREVPRHDAKSVPPPNCEAPRRDEPETQLSPAAEYRIPASRPLWSASGMTGCKCEAEHWPTLRELNVAILHFPPRLLDARSKRAYVIQNGIKRWRNTNQPVAFRASDPDTKFKSFIEHPHFHGLPLA